MPMKNEFGLMRMMLTLAAASVVFGCTPASDGTAAVDQNALDGAARALVRGEDRIGAEALMDLLVTGREPLSIIDIRPRQAFDAGHIKDSLHADAPSLIGVAGRSVLDAGSRLVLVSEDGVEAAQMASLLRVTGVNAYALSGGYAQWRAVIEGQGTALPADADAAREMAKRQAVACWFEGDYVAAAGLAVKPEATSAGGYVPPLQPPSAETQAEDPLGLGLGLGLGEGLEPAEPQPARRRLRVREGC